MSKRLIAISGTTLIGAYSATIVGIKVMIDKLNVVFHGVTNNSNIEVYITSSMLIDLGNYEETCNIIRTSDTRAVIEFKGNVVKCKRIV